MPTRIQQRRTKGWRMPLNAKSVARPSKWGNPWSVVGEFGYDPEGADFWFTSGHEAAIAWAVEQHRLWLHEELQTNILIVEALADLRGLDLACWCAVTSPCHADNLLRELGS